MASAQVRSPGCACPGLQLARAGPPLEGCRPPGRGGTGWPRVWLGFGRKKRPWTARPAGPGRASAGGQVGRLTVGQHAGRTRDGPRRSSRISRPLRVRPRLLRRVTHSAGLRPQNGAASPSGGRRSEVKGPSPRPLLPPGSSSAAAASPPASPMSSPWARVRVRMSPFCEDISRVGSEGTPLRGDLILTDHTCSDLSSDAATF